MNLKVTLLALITAFSLIGCKTTSLTKTKETKRSYAVYNLKVPKEVSSSEMTNAIKSTKIKCI
ncbi:hypothetical protein [Photobacterium leiognathi]|uniref:hypothetical protein n=1 Tax=Photobacterium leiognathi TaxID=553611 RepID=UPI002981A9F7|nr:hypothetical protein [Photobacterium leiognathi]